MVAVAVPLVRGYVRWAPGRLGKRAIVERLVEPRLSRRPYAYRARTIDRTRLQGDHRLIMPRCIYWFGVWEPLLSDWIAQRLRPGDVFVDVGANMGYFTLLAARRVGSAGGVVAIEPGAGAFTKLTTNVALNRGARVRAVHAAAGARAARIPYYRAPWNDAENSTVANPQFEPAGEVEASPLARLLSDAEIAGARLIKIDVEGAEWDVVAGLLPDIARFRHDLELVVEVHPHRGADRTAGALAGMLAPHGFAPAWLPVDFRATAHLERRPRASPRPGLPPPDRLVHLVLSRRAAGVVG